MTSKQKKFNDEVTKHPFYSDEAIKKWRQRIKNLEAEEKKLNKKRRQNIDNT